MSFIVQYSLSIIIVLLLVILILVAIIILLRNSRIYSSSSEGENKSSKYVPLDKHKEILKKYEELQEKCDNIELNNFDISKFYELQDNYEKACVEIGKLKSKIDELTRDNQELDTLYKMSTRREEDTPPLKKQKRDSVPPKKDPQIVRYASFPRSAGSNSYFSDLTEKLADDSYFELIVSDDTNKAIFKPLDFMKIRNYDPAMAAMVTEGVKPNVASTILNIEPGKAHLDGKDWIIDKPAIIKLA